jgi:26S proteasome regulatory subunit N9
MLPVELYLQQQQQARPEHAQWFAAFEELHKKKLWHQLSTKIFEYIEKAPGNKDLLSFYQNFVADFEMKMNPLLLVDFASKVVAQIDNPVACIELIEALKPKVKHNKMASVLCSIIIGEQSQIKNDTDTVKKLLEDLSTEIDDVDGVTPVHARYYLLASDHYKKIGDHCKYYRNSLRYLGCLSDTDATFKSPGPAQMDRAFTMALAALLGDEIYNFGELLQHPIINCIDASKRWVVELLGAFNSGDLAKYEALQPQWSTQPDLVTHALELRKKITLMCLMEMTFKSHDGILTFQEIANYARIDITDVEMLVMRALSLKLVKGTIDQVGGIVHLWWVQPRVLNKAQILSLRSRLDTLCKDVETMERLLESKAQEIIG